MPYKMMVDLRIIATIGLIYLMFVFGQTTLLTEQQAKNRKKIRARASAQVQDYRNKQHTLQALKNKSKPRWVYEIVKNKINN